MMEATTPGPADAVGGAEASIPAPIDAGDEGSDDAAADAPAPVVVSFDACPPGPSTGDFPADVGAAIHSKCQTCHGVPQRHGAPFEIVDYEDVVMPFMNSNESVLRWQRMYQVIQPGSVPHMPLSGPPLTSAEMKTLDDWFAACAPPVPEGTGADQDSAQHNAGDAASSADSATE